ncbi:hypothetical protein ALI22I_02795 [Saccharothrix sp. ALI-22-I]|uniref:hypothetical protein n=1 Tax=Saccharothrix sp. ALI-22-I TaxID=1933778 RepID=UPI00097C174C|nr:hypothetical protein [Saccharothrix sp. ALI-22-I]ONI92617.1 hypothetical protein ALI22I_02795 [Saccharothrix sp. ALI-22-I]
MTNDPDHNGWSLLNHMLNNDAWAPFIRAIILMLLLGAIITTGMIILGTSTAAAGIGAGGTLAASAGKRYLARRRGNRA